MMHPDDNPALTVRAWSRAPSVSWLSSVRPAQRGLVGGKAANLATALQDRLPVPPGFCVTTAAFQRWLHACANDMERLLADLSGRKPEDAPALSRRALACLSNVALPPEVEEAVLRAWRALGETRTYAVRSSATVEDAQSRSFAGQFESFLNVCGREALLEAVRGCWLSLFSERAMAYRLNGELPVGQAAMAVLIQEMVPAETAGVLFTMDPVSGDRSRMVLEATAGLGDRLVGGAINPESLVLNKMTLEVKERRSGGSTMCISDALAREVGRLGLKVERLFGEPQDIEWAVSGGRPVLLQARPITRAPGSEPTEVWTNANVMEALPDVVTPLSWSLMQRLLEDFLYPLMRRLGLEAGPPPLIQLFAGRAYLNLSGISRLVRRIGPMQVDVASAFGGQYPRPVKAGSAGPLRGSSARCTPSSLSRALRVGVWLLPGLVGQQKLIERWGKRALAHLAHETPEGFSDEELAGYPRSVLRLASQGEGERTWAAAAWMGASGVGGGIAVFTLARRWLNDVDGSIANRLLAGAGNMHSAENGLALQRLASWSKASPRLTQALLAPGSFAELQHRLAAVENGREFLARWHEFMLNHGHQARGGMDVAQPRWSEMPDHVLQLVRNCLQIPEEADPIRLQRVRLQEREALLRECRRHLGNPLKRVIFMALVRASQRGLRQRENVKNEGVKLVAALRRAILEAGRRLRRRGALKQPEDVFFLELEEVESALGNGTALDLCERVAARQAQHERRRKLLPPPTIVGDYDENASVAGGESGDATLLTGVAVSPGVVQGKARVLLQADSGSHVLPGEILVAPYTDPGWTPYFLPAAGIVVDVGGLLSHGSVVAREYGLPAVVNVGSATRLIRTGDLVQVDGKRGVVRILERVAVRTNSAEVPVANC